MVEQNPFVKNLEELFMKIKQDIEQDSSISCLYIAKESEDSILEKLLVQPMYRNINGKDVKFLSIRNIKIKEKHKSKKFFTEFIDNIELLKVPILFHDIVNENLISFFSKRGYKFLKEKKYNSELISMYKL